MFVVKVQLSVVTNAPARQVLVYTQDQSLYMQGNAPEDVVTKMGDKLKAFFEAEQVKGAIRLVREVEDPGW